jgi:putative transposase
MDAIFFVLRTGCHWNALNATGICSSSAAHRRFQEWTQAGGFEQLWALGLQEDDELQQIQWVYQAMDGAMTKAPLGGEKTGPNPTDRGKTGTKRSLLVDGRGVPLGVAVAGANCNDHLVVLETLDSVPAACPCPPAALDIGLWLDKGYDSDAVYGVLRQNGYEPHSVPRDAERELKETIPGYVPRRWPVERTISWQNRSRRILVRWEKKLANYQAMVHLACAFIAFKQAGLA